MAVGETVQKPTAEVAPTADEEGTFTWVLASGAESEEAWVGRVEGEKRNNPECLLTVVREGKIF